jgi:membrane-associated protease RseP (regulator of RpoE activity)
VFRHAILVHWRQGLIYMACVLIILLTHEMGHFIATLCYKIRASLPYFLPFPFNPFGTFGAVITMDAMRANRRQMFDIGIAGPLAGLVVSIPILWYGVVTLDLTQPAGGGMALDIPLAIRLLLDYYQPPGYEPGADVWITQVNPFFMAGWVGMLVTAMNMLPISQLDGGHVSYTLFGSFSRWIARGVLMLSIAYMVYVGNHPMWLMVLLILLLGTDHPPTQDDGVRLGWFRTALGYASLAIPIFCFPPLVITQV